MCRIQCMYMKYAVHKHMVNPWLLRVCSLNIFKSHGLTPFVAWDLGDLAASITSYITATGNSNWNTYSLYFHGLPLFHFLLVVSRLYCLWFLNYVHLIHIRMPQVSWGSLQTLATKHTSIIRILYRPECMFIPIYVCTCVYKHSNVTIIN